jgi:[acyl-carrier-protein] S-malonyltransferase
VEVINAMSARGVGSVVECGPGKVLAGLNKRISKEMGTFETLDTDSLMKALETLKGE